MTQNTGLKTEQKPKKGLVVKFADKFGVDQNKLMKTLKSTCFKTKNNNGPSDEEMMALLVVADQYGLNPFTKEIFAFPDKNNGIVPVVGVDGWSRIINQHPQFDGLEFRYSDNMTTPKDGKPCPEWCEVVIYRKDRNRPTVVREFLDEVYRGKMGNYAGPWQSHTKRFLRHKVLIQGARIAFGFSGIYDEDEAERIIDVTPTQDAPPRPQKSEFEPQDAVELFQLRTVFGDNAGECSKADFVRYIVRDIEQHDDAGLIAALMEHNADSIESLGTRSEERKEIAEALNIARENFAQSKPDQKPQDEAGHGGTTSPEPSDEQKPGIDQEIDWKEWCKTFSDTIGMASTQSMLNKLLKNMRAEFQKLQSIHPKWHQELLDRVNAKDAELTPQNKDA